MANSQVITLPTARARTGGPSPVAAPRNRVVAFFVGLADAFREARELETRMLGTNGYRRFGES